MTSAVLAWEGAMLGLAVAARVGPVEVLAVNASCFRAWSSGFRVGLGAATVDAAYAATGVVAGDHLGRRPVVAEAVDAAAAVAVLLIGVLYVRVALRMCRSGGQEPPGPMSALSIRAGEHAYRLGVVIRSADVQTIAFWAALAGFAGLRGWDDRPGDLLVLVVGVGLGTATWFMGLATGGAVGARRIRPVWVVPLGAGLVLVATGCVRIGAVVR